MMERSPYMDQMMSEMRRLTDIVDKDMQVYDITGAMDVEAQNAAITGLGATIDQIRAAIAESNADLRNRPWYRK